MFKEISGSYLKLLAVIMFAFMVFMKVKYGDKIADLDKSVNHATPPPITAGSQP
jgi:hypothetical protein